MNVELFGVFGDRDAFERVRPARDFDRIVEGETVTVGLRDDALGLPGRTCVEEASAGTAIVFGEAFPPTAHTGTAANWLLGRYHTSGPAAFGTLDGSYLAVVDTGDDALVAADSIRTWECFTTIQDGTRVFGTDAVTVSRAIHEPALDPRGFAEFLYLGGALNDHTMLASLDRVPFDHALGRDRVLPLGRYHHDPSSFDYEAELARRLERAVERRARGPAPHAALLSAGYDSRLLLACSETIDRAYTIGHQHSDEVSVAADIATDHGATHTTLPVDGRYLDLDESAIRATNGVKESLHIHHAGYTGAIDAATVSHGLLLDTLLRGYFLPQRTHEVLGLTIPRGGLDQNPDPVAHLTSILGYLPDTAPLLPETPGLDVDSAESFLQTTISDAYDTCLAASTDEYAAFERFGVQNVLSSPFHTHLADQYTASFVAADADLVDWHLSTPPSVRTTDTYRNALRRIDDDILEPRPPDRPHDSLLANQAEKRIRRSLPGLPPFDDPWPDRRAAYRAHDLDAEILPDAPQLHQYPPRFKLRIRDARRWLTQATDGDIRLVDHLPTVA